MDLSLVPIETLIEELHNRTEVGVVGYTRNVDAGDPVVMVSHWGNWLKGIGITETIKDTLLDKNLRIIDA